LCEDSVKKEDKLTQVGDVPAAGPLSSQYFTLNATGAKPTRNENTAATDARSQVLHGHG